MCITMELYRLDVYGRVLWCDLHFILKELGVSNHPDYKLVCMLDHAAMVTVHAEGYKVFDCKPLAFIWEKFPGIYHERNTVMLDDLK